MEAVRRFAESGREGKFAKFLATGHAKSTQAEYARVWEKVWPAFLATTLEEEDKGTADLYLRDVTGTLEKSNLWARFIYHLKEVVRVPSKRVSGQLRMILWTQTKVTKSRSKSSPN